MSYLDAIIVAIIQGITEFLPISSTGHISIAESLMGIKKTDFVILNTVSIHFGTILAVIVVYWKRFFHSLSFYYRLFIAFIPAAVIGLAFGKYVDMLEENVFVAVGAIFLGGVFLIFVDKIFEKNEENNDIENKEPSYKSSFIIGIFQAIAMIPGVSRSAATIVGGLTQKLNRRNATEFAFLLSVPTVLAASVYKMYKAKDLLSINDINLLIIGNIVSFVVAIFAIKTFIAIIQKYGFKAFGYYRIIFAAIIIIIYFAFPSLGLTLD